MFDVFFLVSSTPTLCFFFIESQKYLIQDPILDSKKEIVDYENEKSEKTSKKLRVYQSMKIRDQISVIN